ncbi:MAG: hypothetical protein ABEJ43_01520 [Haloferacaceae archaeon]
MTDETPRERMERGIRAVRREGQKAALVEATVEAVAALLVVNFVLGIVPVAQLPSSLPVPGAPVPALETVDTDAVVAVVAGLVVFGGGIWYRLRQPTVEQFAAVNPELSEALRTARDAVESGAEGQMAARLYEETVERLGEASSVGLLHLRRVGVVLLVVAVLAPASIGTTAAGFELVLGGGDESTAPGSSVTDEYEGLADPDSVLGEAENVETGDEAVNATVGSQGGGGNESRSAAAAYESGFGAPGTAEAETQQAGFAEQERLEDAELIREYNLRIRQETDDENTQ